MITVVRHRKSDVCKVQLTRDEAHTTLYKVEVYYLRDGEFSPVEISSYARRFQAEAEYDRTVRRRITEYKRVNR